MAVFVLHGMATGEDDMEWLLRDTTAQWKVGDVLEIRIDGKLMDRGRVQEIVQEGVFRLDLESGPFTVHRAPED